MPTASRAFYSAQTCVNNLGFTLTPDSFLSFRDATWPLLAMTFLALAGNTAYPILLRCAIWSWHRLTPPRSPRRELLAFLLDHPRRCYTLLFPSTTTWVLLGILALLTAVDTVLILVLDLRNPELVDTLPAAGPRVLAALFQATMSRHTGASVFNLAAVNPAVQFSLLVMMYIAVLPIAITVRASNAYEERSLGLFGDALGARSVDERPGAAGGRRSYVGTHLRNQLSFDLWYVFLGTFCICIAEAARIADNGEPSFSVFTVMFEVVSA